MVYTDLGGHSGCRILLCEEERGEVFVRKISSGQKYNSRLMRQADKQKNYSGFRVKVPRILNDGYTDEGLFYFDMEYIRGMTLAEYMKSVEIGKIRGIVECLMENQDLSEGKCCAENSQKLFVEKIQILKSKLEPQNNSVINSAIGLLENHDWSTFPETVCHGDLTLENIIVKNDSLYLIDFLDSFYDSWFLDIATLMQDVWSMWSYRNENVNINTIIRLVVFRDILMDKLEEFAGDRGYREVWYALLLKMIRIYPYAQDEQTYRYLNEKTKLITESIEKENHK